LGGAGLAVSAHCRNRETAVDYIAYATSPEIQRSFYFESGGQPGHRLAWLDDTVNLISNNFFKNTLKSHDHAFLRYRYNGYIHFQRNAGKPINDYFQNGGNEKDVLKTMNEIYRESKKIT
jgi:multiple sugar transport system substrate-binding protein